MVVGRILRLLDAVFVCKLGVGVQPNCQTWIRDHVLRTFDWGIALLCVYMSYG